MSEDTTTLSDESAETRAARKVREGLVTSTNMFAVSANPTRWGAGWNMDRWKLSQ